MNTRQILLTQNFFFYLSFSISSIFFVLTCYSFADKGVHNALMHEGSMPHIKFFSQSSSPVMNLQAKKAVLTDNEIFNSQGERAAVVHQYDREPSYQQYLFAKVRLLGVKELRLFSLCV